MRNDQEAIDTLLTLGLGITEEQAKDAISKYNGDLDMAASSFFQDAVPHPGGPRQRTLSESIMDDLPPLEDSVHVWKRNQVSSRGILNSTPDPAHNKPMGPHEIVDLTGDDDENDPELQKAMNLSLQGSQSISVAPFQSFGPSTRVDMDQKYALVPVTSNKENNGISTVMTQDDAYTRAIEASLNSSQVFTETYSDVSPRNRIRTPELPVCLRTSLSHATWFPPLLQALYHVPQFNEFFMLWRAVDDVFSARTENEESIAHLYYVQEYFTLLAQSQQTYINIDRLINTLSQFKTFAGVFDGYSGVRERSDAYLVRLMSDIRMQASLGCEWQPHVTAEFIHSWFHEPLPSMPLQQNSITLRPSISAPTLPSALELFFSTRPPNQRYFLDPPEVLSFLVIPSNSKDNFKFPEKFYGDRWCFENQDLVWPLKNKEVSLKGLVDEGQGRLDKFGFGEEAPKNLEKLKTTLYYLENLSLLHSTTEEGREEKVKHAADELKKVIEGLEKAAKSYAGNIEKIRKQLDEVYETPQMKNYDYELRAVLYHTGLFRRSDVYSYVKNDDYDGSWYKCVDGVATLAEKDAHLNDTTGIHLGAGAYMLFYSRPHLEEDFEDYELVPGGARTPFARTKKVSWPYKHLMNARVENANFRKRLSFHDAYHLENEEGSAPPPSELGDIYGEGADVSNASSVMGDTSEDAGGLEMSRASSEMEIEGRGGETKKLNEDIVNTGLGKAEGVD